jgi:hypothetical protein
VTIEFHCPFCQKLLKTPDDKAGVRANCPGCGEMVTVPSSEHEVSHVDPSFEEAAPLADVRAGRSASERDDDDEIADDDRSAGATKKCPMCGMEIKLAAKRCRFCGETFSAQRDTGAPTKIDAGDSLSAAWEIYKNNLGILLGATLILGGVWLALQFAGQVAQQIVVASVMGPGGAPPPGNPGPAFLAVIGASLFFGILTFAVVSCYLQAGYSRLLLRVARGENVEISEMFSGGRFFWRAFFANFLFSLMSTFGLLLLIVPGVFVMLAFWPFLFAIVDRDEGVIESFQTSLELTSGNYLAGFLLGLVWFGLWVGGLAACCIGLLFSYPLAMLALAVAYCNMSGESVGRS